MDYFDYETAARDAGISEEDLAAIKNAMRKEFPTDDMMWELHVLRACMAIKAGTASVESVVSRKAA